MRPAESCGQLTTPTVELILQRVHPEDAALVQQTVERATQDEKDFDHEYRLMMPDGSLKHLHVAARALNDELGTVEFVGAVMDVTQAQTRRGGFQADQRVWRRSVQASPSS